ncbi:hypothetical protein IB279_13720 [Ensifer sp. ENS06]|uniref:hypothetical protein n=1 Tax=Ensifer sp. ENS06 TaxID=2769276 RepID=UPI00177D7023|nr:hypothetical protein [Ensifer sp. ENS06]MBD9624001.1 hypothetical protein [Ensifer sp. ENS06]
MNKLGHRHWIIIGCLAVALFAAANVWLYLLPVDVSPLEEAGSPPARKIATANDPLVVSFDLTEALARPLFSPTRREFAPPPEVVEEEPLPLTPQIASVDVAPPSFSLHGTRNILSRPAALISLNDQSQGEWYEVGQSIDGWQLVAVRPNGISITKADVAREVRLYDASDAQNAPH